VRVARLLLKRIALGLLSIWGVLSMILLVFLSTRDWYLDTVLASRGPQALNDYSLRQRQVLVDGSVGDSYAEWIGNMFTLQWGRSFEYGREALPMVLRGAARTGAYVLPAILIAALLGLAIGVVTGIYSKSRGEGATRILTYVGMGAPSFWVGAMALALAGGAAVILRPVFLTGQGQGTPQIAVTEWSFLYSHALPILLLATTLTAAVASYARAYSMQYYADDLTKLVRAKGGGRLAVARHVVRNAAVPLVSILFAETLALIAISVFVIEAVFAIDGIGSLFYNAVWRKDYPLVLGSAMVFVALGVAGNIVQDLVYSVLDPRVEADSL
jgi:peptide/nickel transport system permease protein